MPFCGLGGCGVHCSLTWQTSLRSSQIYHICYFKAERGSQYPITKPSYLKIQSSCRAQGLSRDAVSIAAAVKWPGTIQIYGCRLHKIVPVMLQVDSSTNAIPQVADILMSPFCEGHYRSTISRFLRWVHSGIDRRYSPLLAGMANIRPNKPRLPHTN